MRRSLLSLMTLLGPLACAGAPTGDDEESTGDGDPSCSAEDHTVDFHHDWSEFLDSTYDGTCTVASADLDLDGLVLQLDCPDLPDPLAITIASTPSLTFTPPLVGDSLRVRSLYDTPSWSNQYLRLDRVDDAGQRHLLTLVESETLQLDDPAYELPLVFETLAIPCERFIDGCHYVERLALAFEVDGQPNELLDSTHALVGSQTEIWIATAMVYHESLCTDSPEEWFKVLITNPQ
jgi:hypothetical protein